MEMIVIKAYLDYVVAHNKKPDSLLSDETFINLYRLVEKHYGDNTDYVIINLTRLKSYNDRKSIMVAENLKSLIDNGF